MTKRCTYQAITLVLLLSATLNVWAAKPTASEPSRLYKFKNAQGAVIIKDTLPPQVVPLGYSIVDRYGNVIETIAPARTEKQIAIDRRHRIAAKAEQKRIREQLKRDNDLLRQFTATADIERARDNQIDSIRVEIGIRKANTNRIRRQLEKYQRLAAEFERRGQPTPKAIKDNITQSLKQITASEVFVASKNSAMLKIRQRFSVDIARFEELQTQRQRRLAENEAQKKRDSKFVYHCDDFNVCARAWQLAQIYAKDHSTGRIELITDTLIIAEKPVRDKDISLTFSRIPDRDNKVEIRLDVYCAKTSAGKGLCVSSKVHNIRRGFIPYLKRHL